ncbi:VOC family protein [Hymenobacter arizonensis]|uniref:PhnB protein n=1 Tax=Hymenobacter arizonensis TaxID=1227077 RepID=A0A1I5ZT07_HYMAR|nr:VOC family protein [Hymenobacter arizonensis]SFQ59588.1 PhnB protein [Hymenobacter arizonensis]
MPQLSPYLSFEGNCREAMTFYQSCLGGELVVQSFAESALADQVPAADGHKVLHSMLTHGSLVLMASDVGGGGPVGSLTEGNTVSLCLNCDSPEEITTLFAKLAAGGTVVDPLAEMFWGTFGSITDRYGKTWLFNYTPADTSPNL